MDIAKQSPVRASIDGVIAEAKPYIARIRQDAPQADGTSYQNSALVEAVLRTFERKVFSIFEKASRSYEQSADAAVRSGALDVIDAQAKADVVAAGLNVGARSGRVDPLAAARRGRIDQITAALTARVGQQYAGVAASAAQEVVDGIEALRQSIAKARLDLELPKTLRSSTSPDAGDLVTILARAERRREAETAFFENPARFLLIYRKLRDTDPTKAAEVRSLVRDAVGELADGRKASTRSQMSKVDNENALALRAEFRNDDRQEIPPEVEAAETLLTRLIVLAQRTVGVNWALGGGKTAGEFTSLIERGGVMRAMSDVAIRPDWPTRFLPSGTRPAELFTLPVWVPLGAQFDDGASSGDSKQTPNARLPKKGSAR